MLVAIIPLFTIAQKRSKKSKKSQTNATYDFMVITGYQVEVHGKVKEESGRAPTPHMRVKNLMHSNAKVTIEFDLAQKFKEEEIRLNEGSRNFRTMVDAVAAAAENGWEFQSANVVPVGQSKIYYYYMRRDN